MFRFVEGRCRKVEQNVGVGEVRMNPEKCWIREYSSAQIAFCWNHEIEIVVHDISTERLERKKSPDVNEKVGHSFSSELRSMADSSRPTPTPPAFPSRLGNNAGIWEAVVHDEDQEESLEDAEPIEDDNEDGTFMTEEFRADLRKLEVRQQLDFSIDTHTTTRKPGIVD